MVKSCSNQFTDSCSLGREYEIYQRYTEDKIQETNEQLILVEKKLDTVTALVEMIKYINLNITNESILSLINDMLLGMIGSTYSTIYSFEKDMIAKEVSNAPSENPNQPTIINHLFMQENKYEPIIINNKDNLFIDKISNIPICSMLGVPINFNDAILGYIVLEHTNNNFFNDDNLNFVTAVANQMGILLENNRLYKEIEERSNKDTLVNMYNRRYFFQTINNKVETNTDDKFAIIMIDIDNFKKVNDTYGHLFGDEVLIKTADIIVKHVSNKGICARYGGEEIIIYIPNYKDCNELYCFIEELRIRVASNHIKYNNEEISITISLGVSMCDSSIIKLDKVVKVADELLYESKNSGKNKTIMKNCK